MRVATVDMFGTSPGRGSALDVLLPDVDTDRSWDEEAVEELLDDAAAHARRSHADETALVSRCSREERTFGSRIFNSDGETPFGTHSLAGVAACLAESGHVARGEIARTSDAGSQRALDRRASGPRAVRRVASSTTRSRSTARRAKPTAGREPMPSAWVADSPSCGCRRTPVASLHPISDRMRESGTTDLTVYRWDPDRRQVLARVFAPGFGIPEDAGCLPVAAALGTAVLRMAPASQAPVTVTQVTARDTESVFTCEGTVRDDSARLTVTGRVWIERQDARSAP